MAQMVGFLPLKQESWMEFPVADLVWSRSSRHQQLGNELAYGTFCPSFFQLADDTYLNGFIGVYLFIHICTF